MCGGEVIKDLIRIAGTWRLTPEMIAENPEAKAAADRAPPIRRNTRPWP